MDPALTMALVIFAFSGVSAFVGYWWGYGNAETAGRDRNLRLKAQIHEMNLFTLDLAERVYALKGYRHRSAHQLTPAEAAQFEQNSEQLRKDTA